MAPGADDPALVEDDDPVGVTDGRHPLGDDHHRRLGGLLRKRRAQRRVGRVVERGEGVVEEIDLRALDQSAGDREALPLASRDVRPALGDGGVQTVLQFRHELLGLRHLQRVPQLLVGRVRIAVAQIRGDRAREQVRLLRDEPDRPRQQLGVDLLDVHAVHEHLALGGVEEAGHQTEQGRFAAAGGADDGGDLAGPRHEVDGLEDRLLGTRVAEPGFADLQVAVTPQLGHGCEGRNDARLRVEHLLDALGTDLRARHHHEHEGGHHHGHDDLHEVGEERRQIADLHAAAVDAVRAEPDHRDGGEVHHRHHDGNISASVRPVFRDTSVRSVLAPRKRSFS